MVITTKSTECHLNEFHELRVASCEWVWTIWNSIAMQDYTGKYSFNVIIPRIAEVEIWFDGQAKDAYTGHWICTYFLHRDAHSQPVCESGYHLWRIAFLSVDQWSLNSMCLWTVCVFVCVCLLFFLSSLCPVLVHPACTFANLPFLPFLLPAFTHNPRQCVCILFLLLFFLHSFFLSAQSKQGEREKPIEWTAGSVCVVVCVCVCVYVCVCMWIEQFQTSRWMALGWCSGWTE